jgi:tetratricopeptide (TPR) repeat protein
VRKGQWTEASADFDRAIALKPDSADLLVIRGMALGRNGFRELAIVDFNRAIELDGNFVEAYIGRGNTFAARQDFGRALADYDRALSLAPGQQQARTLKAIATKNQAALGSSDPKGIRTITIRPEPGLKYERGKTNSGESAATPP